MHEFQVRNYEKKYVICSRMFDVWKYIKIETHWLIDKNSNTLFYNPKPQLIALNYMQPYKYMEFVCCNKTHLLGASRYDVYSTLFFISDCVAIRCHN